jgi:succinate dehydrogenase / fumarate reductase membrane anchor subunit
VVKSRHVIGAHYGVAGWLVQRMSAVVMAAYTLIVLGVLLAQPPTSYLAWRDLFAHGWMRLATLLFFVAMMLHAWIGMRDVVMDYLRSTALRLTAEVVFIVMLVAYAAWAVHILWRA